MPEDLSRFCCQNEQCPDYGQRGLGNLTVCARYGKDRTFFFVAYEGLRDEFPEPDQFTVPTDAMRRGDFSALLSQGIVIYNPFPGVRLPDGPIQRTPLHQSFHSPWGRYTVRARAPGSITGAMSRSSPRRYCCCSVQARGSSG